MSFNLKATGTETKKSTGASLGNDIENLPKVIRIVREMVSVPIIVKFFPEGGMLINASHICLSEGADAVGHSGNLLGIPDIDVRRPKESIYRLQDQITLGCLSGPWVRPVALRATYQLRRVLGPQAFIIGSGGVDDVQSAVQQIMIGSDMVWICTETMLRGFDWFPKVLDGFEKYMKEMGYNSIRDFRDILIGNIASAQDLTIHRGYAQIDSEKCTSCGICSKVGHCYAINFDKKVVINRKDCLGCSTCVDMCPKKAISMTKE